MDKHTNLDVLYKRTYNLVTIVILPVVSGILSSVVSQKDGSPHWFLMTTFLTIGIYMVTYKFYNNIKATLSYDRKKLIEKIYKL